MAAGRVLGAGAQGVRHRSRQVPWLTRRKHVTDPGEVPGEARAASSRSRGVPGGRPPGLNSVTDPGNYVGGSGDAPHEARAASSRSRGAPGGRPPGLVVVRGDANHVEIAALAAVLAAAAARGRAGAGEKPGSVRNNWNEKSRLMRSAVHPSAGGWRRSALP
ncbi:acyl-CoA carboxylase epsilon subunit [Trebonia sp.]|uniref:acyl-CoA carboxylase epsilon subunit n=1 Tax=Trebonia sp. TaxID=2767075 RepID=UPI0026147892|nr:acyl-CoA carboxylase epsilon subunit [Trebonia sp.]